MKAINLKTKNAIERITGLSSVEIGNMEIEEVDSVIEKKIGKKLKIDTRLDSHFIPRGNVYLFLRRFLSMRLIEKTLGRI